MRDVEWKFVEMYGTDPGREGARSAVSHIDEKIASLKVDCDEDIKVLQALRLRYLKIIGVNEQAQNRVAPVSRKEAAHQRLLGIDPRKKSSDDDQVTAAREAFQAGLDGDELSGDFIHYAT